MKNIFLITTFLFLTQPIYAVSFTDSSNIPPYAVKGITDLFEKGIIKGNRDGSFAPKRTVNRAEFCKMIVLATGVEIDKTNVPSFPDVEIHKWYSPYIEAAKKEGWVNGYPDGKFRPANTINRAEISKILVNAFGLSSSGSEQDSNWYDRYVRVLKNKSLMPHNTSNFSPSLNPSRAEIAEQLYRFINQQEINKEVDVAPIVTTVINRPTNPVPQGIYFLTSRKTTETDLRQALGKPFVDGIAVRSGWDAIEPTEGNFNFSSIDSQIEIANEYEKKVSLAVLAGAEAVPDWLFTKKNVEKWTRIKNGEEEVLANPMNQNYYTYWNKAVQALGEKYNENKTITQISICGGTGTLCGARFPIAYPKNWDREIFISNWKSTIDTYVGAFPNTYLHLEIHASNGDSTNISEDLFSYAQKYGDKIGPFQEFLTDNTPVLDSSLGATMKNWGDTIGWCAFQATKPLAYSLGDGYEHGLEDFGCRYFEIYKNDIFDSAFDSVNQQWHDQIWE